MRDNRWVHLTRPFSLDFLKLFALLCFAFAWNTKTTSGLAGSGVLGCNITGKQASQKNINERGKLLIRA